MSRRQKSEGAGLRLVRPRPVPYGLPLVPDTLVVIEWLDASNQKGPVGREELDSEYIIHSVGWLLQDTEEKVVIAQEYIPGLEQFRDVTHIPKAYIRRRQDYRT